MGTGFNKEPIWFPHCGSLHKPRQIDFSVAFVDSCGRKTDRFFLIYPWDTPNNSVVLTNAFLMCSLANAIPTTSEYPLCWGAQCNACKLDSCSWLVFHDFPSSFGLLQELMGTNFQTGKNKPPCRGGREMGSGLAFTDVPFFLASETRCVDSKGAGVLGEDDWPWISQLEWHWLGHSHQVHRGDTSQMWKISGPASFLVLPLKGGICKLECGQFCPRQLWAC